MEIRYPRARLNTILDVVTSLLLIVAASALIYRNVIVSPGPSASGPMVEVPSEPLSIEGVPLKGSKSAKVVMIVYSDFECPFCGRFAREILPELERRYVATGEVAFVFHHLPLAFHPLATQAAVSAECAGQQGRFWEAHDLLFSFDRGRVCQVVEKVSRVIIRRDDVTTLPFSPPSYPDSHRAFAV